MKRVLLLLAVACHPLTANVPTEPDVVEECSAFSFEAVSGIYGHTSAVFVLDGAVHAVLRSQTRGVYRIGAEGSAERVLWPLPLGFSAHGVFLRDEVLHYAGNIRSSSVLYTHDLVANATTSAQPFEMEQIKQITGGPDDEALYAVGHRGHGASVWRAENGVDWMRLDGPRDRDIEGTSDVLYVRPGEVVFSAGVGVCDDGACLHHLKEGAVEEIALPTHANTLALHGDVVLAGLDSGAIMTIDDGVAVQVSDPFVEQPGTGCSPPRAEAWSIQEIVSGGDRYYYANCQWIGETLSDGRLCEPQPIPDELELRTVRSMTFVDDHIILTGVDRAVRVRIQR